LYKFTQIFNPIKELLIILGSIAYETAYDVYEWLWALANGSDEKDKLYKGLVRIFHPDITKNERFAEIFSYINTIRDGIPTESIKRKLQEIETSDGIDAFSKLEEIFATKKDTGPIEMEIGQQSADELYDAYERYLARRRERKEEEGKLNVPTFMRRHRDYVPPTQEERKPESKWEKQRKETSF
jgi:hypothetical protein